MPTSPRGVFENVKGMVTFEAPDLIPQGGYAYLENTRRLLGGRITARPPIGNNLLASSIGSGVTSVARLNDPYYSGQYNYIEGDAAGEIWINPSKVATGLSGNPLSFLPYRPPASPQPWMYVGDPSLTVSIPAYIASGYGTVAGMLKLRADGLIYKTGIKEPQVAPGITVGPGTTGPNSIVYRYTYRDSNTGAVSNPSPESTPVQNGADNAAAVAGVSNFNPTQYTNYTGSSGSGGIMNGQWGSEYGGHNQFATINNGGPQLLLTPIQTQNMTDSMFGEAAYPVPAGATITGIQFQLNWLNGSGAAPGTLVNCQLAYQGALIGTQKQPGIVSTSTDPGGTYGNGTLISGNGDLWGAALTPAIVNDPTFGVNFQIQQGAASGGGNQLFINVVYVVIYWSVPSATVSPTASLDPQVDVNDIYRMGGALENFTYVGTTPNGVAFNDTLLDGAAALNPILDFDNYEPFPSIDLPKSGLVNSDGAGNITYVSGDHFNIRWLPGTIVLIAGIAYVMYNRPSSTTAMIVYTTQVSGDTITFAYPPVGTHVTYEIAEPDLANEPSPVIWGPTPDSAGSFYFGLDPNNPGDLLWSERQQLRLRSRYQPPDFDLSIRSPDERHNHVGADHGILYGAILADLPELCRRGGDGNWHFGSAVDTGAVGIEARLIHALRHRRIGTLMRGARRTAFSSRRAAVLSRKSVARSTICFPTASPRLLSPSSSVALSSSLRTIRGQTHQTITVIPGYIFYDYQDTNGNPRTLVYDSEAKGWNVDVTTPVANCHALPVEANQILLGCVDGTVRAFDNNATEDSNAIVSTPSINGGSPRTVKRIGGVFIRALPSSIVLPTFWMNRYAAEITGVTPNHIGPAGVETDYLMDFTASPNADVLDLAASFSFPIGGTTWLKEWQPDWAEIPEQIVAWRTGMLAYGLDGWLHSPWLRFAYASTTQVNLTINTDQGASYTVAVPSSGGQPAKFFAWLPAVDGAGVSMKYRLLEWVADAGGTPWTNYGKDHELAIKSWGSTGPYQIIRPFRPQEGSST